MKKLLCALLALLVLSGCSNTGTAVSDPQGVVLTINEKEYTREELYSFMVANGASYYVVNEAQKLILNAEVPQTEEMVTTAEESMAGFKEMFGESFLPYLQSMGYPTEESYLNDLVVAEQLKVLDRQYIESNYETLAARFAPKQFQLLEYADEASATNAIAELDAGTDFEEVAANTGSTNTGAPLIYTTQSTFDLNVLYELESLSIGEHSPVTVPSSDTTKYYVVKLLETDTTVLKEDVINELMTLGATAEETITHYFGEYDFQIYDPTIHEQVSVNYPTFLGE